MTVNELASDFDFNYMTNRLRPTTISGYRVNLNNHILPYIGILSLDSVSLSDIDSLVSNLYDKGLSSKSVVYVLAVLRKMLNYAVKRGYVQYNIITRYDMPRVNKYHYTVLNADQMKKLLDAARTRDDLWLPVMLAAKYGLRRGEILGLIPSVDYDSKNNVLHIQRTKVVVNGVVSITPCKTKHSDRYIMLVPSDGALLVGISGYLTDMTSNVLDNSFRCLLAELGLPLIRFHDLRHSYATYMMSCGVNPKIISSVLGHSRVSTTLDIYTHPDVDMQKSCIDRLSYFE